MKKISLIRHGETDWNVEGRIQGHTDIPLNAKGMLQAKERAKALQQEPFDVCFSSDLSRARQTAQILITGRAIPFYLDTRLRERSHGTLEGLLWHDYHAMNPQERALIVESPDKVVDRLFIVLDEIAHVNVLIVTHGGVMKALLHRLLAPSQDIPRSVDKVAFNTVGAPGLQQAEPMSKQPMCKHMGDADSCKDVDAGAVKSNFVNRSRYIFVRNAALLQMSWHQGRARILYHDGIDIPSHYH